MCTSAIPEEKHALLFFTHLFNKRNFAKFQTLQKVFSKYGDTFTLYFAETGELNAPAKFHPYGSSRKTLDTLNYVWMHDRLMPGHSCYPLMHFARQHPDYKSYTLIEYDVELTGSWDVFFEHIMRDDADFLATHIADESEQPDWYFWNTLSLPPNGAAVNSGNRKIRFFGPIYKISNRALKTIDAAYTARAIGHFEGLIPTVLSGEGLIVRDFNELSHPKFRGDNRWYTKQAFDPSGKLEKSSMRFRPNRLFPGWRPFTLYHPVKFGKGERLTHLRDKLRKLLR